MRRRGSTPSSSFHLIAVARDVVRSKNVKVSSTTDTEVASFAPCPSSASHEATAASWWGVEGGELIGGQVHLRLLHGCQCHLSGDTRQATANRTAESESRAEGGG